MYTHIHIYIYTHLYTYMYIYIYTYRVCGKGDHLLTLTRGNHLSNTTGLTQDFFELGA